MHIRPETPAEFPALYAFTQTVFSTAKVSDGAEQDFVNKLRAGQNYIPQLALVAEEDGKIVGHIMLTRTQLALEDGGEKTVLMLAPLSVDIAKRGQGVGAQLTREAFNRARELGYDACVLIGDPAYYGRFGFVEFARFGLTCKQDIPAPYAQACELQPGALAGLRGTIDFLG